MYALLATTEGTHGGPKEISVVQDGSRFGVGRKFGGSNTTYDWYETREAAFVEAGKRVAKMSGRLRKIK